MENLEEDILEKGGGGCWHGHGQGEGRPFAHITRAACGPHVLGWSVDDDDDDGVCCWLGSRKRKILKGGGPQTARGLGLVNPEPPQQQIKKERRREEKARGQAYPTRHPTQPNRSGTAVPTPSHPQ